LKANSELQQANNMHTATPQIKRIR